MDGNSPAFFNPITFVIVLLCAGTLWNTWELDALKARLDQAIEQTDKTTREQNSVTGKTVSQWQKTMQVLEKTGARIEKMEQRLTDQSNRRKTPIPRQTQEEWTDDHDYAPSENIIIRNPAQSRSRAIFRGKCTNC